MSFTFGGNNNNNNNQQNSNTNNSFAWNSNNNTNNNNNNNNANKNSSSQWFGLNNNNNNNNNFNFNGNNNSNSNSNNNPNFNFPPQNVSNPAHSNNNNHSFDNPLSEMQRIADEYNPQSQSCRFETVLYNKVPSNMNVPSFHKPPLIRTQIWEQGIKNNPSPNNLIPVGVRGYSQLYERSNLCLAGHCSSIKSFEEISAKLNTLKEIIDLKTRQSIHDLKQTQIDLSHKLLCILRTYITKMTSSTENESSSISFHGNSDILNNNQNITNLSLHSIDNGINGLTAKEMTFKRVLDQISRESKQLINFYAHIDKLTNELGIDGKVNEMNARQTVGYTGNNSVITEGLDHPDPQNMKQMFAFLKQQQQFIGLLSKTIQNDTKDLTVILNGMQTNNDLPKHSVLF